MDPSTPPKTPAKSLQILRRRVREEMRKPGDGGEPLFKSDAQLARHLGLTGSAVSHFLRTDKRGVSWEILDRLATLFGLEIWQLFYTNAPYTWDRSKARDAKALSHDRHSSS